jgi:hypothetical protein
MRNSIAILILFALTACSLGFALAEESVKVNESANATENATLNNQTLENETLINETLENATEINETLTNETITNETDSDANPFENTKGRQPSRH